MDDQEVLARITHLVEDEHRLEESHVGDGISKGEQERLKEIEVALDQCWDLLRQRRARRNAGLDPDEAQLRPDETVEGYRQ